MPGAPGGQLYEKPVCRPLAVRCYASAMVRRGVHTAGLIIGIALLLVPTGCMGWGDMFAPRHRISGDYFLQQGEDPKGDEVYLFVKGASVSVAGPLHQIGWNGQYILFTDANWPAPWNVIRIADHRMSRISAQQMQSDGAFTGIRILSASSAWHQKPN